MEQTDKCHCFRDRVFNPADRFKSDDYLLATVGNSLIASHFNISKRQIVMLKMQGSASNNDLLIGLYVSRLTGSEIKVLLTAKEQASWQQLVTKNAVLKTIDNDPVLNLIIQEESMESTNREISNIMLQKRFSFPDGTLAVLYKENLTPREAALVLTLAEHTGVPPEVIASQNRLNGLSWSEIAHNFGLQPAEVGKLILP